MNLVHSSTWRALAGLALTLLLAACSQNSSHSLPEWAVNGLEAAMNDKDAAVRRFAYEELVALLQKGRATPSQFRRSIPIIARDFCVTDVRSKLKCNPSRQEGSTVLAALEAYAALGAPDEHLNRLVLRRTTDDQLHDVRVKALTGLAAVNSRMLKKIGAIEQIVGYLEEPPRLVGPGAAAGPGSSVAGEELRRAALTAACEGSLRWRFPTELGIGREILLGLLEVQDSETREVAASCFELKMSERSKKAIQLDLLDRIEDQNDPLLRESLLRALAKTGGAGSRVGARLAGLQRSEAVLAVRNVVLRTRVQLGLVMPRDLWSFLETPESAGVATVLRLLAESARKSKGRPLEGVEQGLGKFLDASASRDVQLAALDAVAATCTRNCYANRIVGLLSANSSGTGDLDGQLRLAALKSLTPEGACRKVSTCSSVSADADRVVAEALVGMIEESDRALLRDELRVAVVKAFWAAGEESSRRLPDVRTLLERRAREKGQLDKETAEVDEEDRRTRIAAAAVSVLAYKPERMRSDNEVLWPWLDNEQLVVEAFVGSLADSGGSGRYIAGLMPILDARKSEDRSGKLRLLMLRILDDFLESREGLRSIYSQDFLDLIIDSRNPEVLRKAALALVMRGPVSPEQLLEILGPVYSGRTREEMAFPLDPLLTRDRRRFLGRYFGEISEAHRRLLVNLVLIDEPEAGGTATRDVFSSYVELTGLPGLPQNAGNELAMELVRLSHNIRWSCDDRSLLENAATRLRGKNYWREAAAVDLQASRLDDRYCANETMRRNARVAILYIVLALLVIGLLRGFRS